MAQPVQRVIHTRAGEQRQRLVGAVRWLIGAVGDAVVHHREVGQVEHVAHQLPALGTEIALNVIVLGERKVHWDWLRAGSNFQRGAVVFSSRRNCSKVVVAVEIGPRQRRFVDAGAMHKAVGEP